MENVVKTWEDGFQLRRMTKADARLVQQWFADISPTGADLEAALSAALTDDGFFMGDLNGKSIAVVVANKMADNIYDITSLFIQKEHQRMGLATRLMAFLLDRYSTKVLFGDTYPHIAGLYARVTEVEEYGRIQRYVGTVQPAWAHQSMAAMKRITSADMTEVIAYDNKCFITRDSVNRKSLLKAWFNIDGNVAYSAANNSGDMVGYVCRRPTYKKREHIIGPLYADTCSLAVELVRKVCEDIPDDIIYIELNTMNMNMTQLVNEVQLTLHCEFVTLWHNLSKELTTKVRSDRVYGITSLDVCGH